VPVKPVPEDHNSVSPYIIVPGAARLIDFLKQTFEAAELGRMAQPDGTIMHAEVKIADSVIMIADASAEYGPMPARLHVYVTDVDSAYQRALQAGATSQMEPADQFYGDRESGVIDPFGNVWWIGMHKEDVSADELAKRAEAFAREQGHGDTQAR